MRKVWIFEKYSSLYVWALRIGCSGNVNVIVPDYSPICSNNKITFFFLQKIMAQEGLYFLEDP